MDKKQMNTKTEQLNKRQNNALPDRGRDSVRYGSAGQRKYGMRPVKKSQKMKNEKIIKFFPDYSVADRHRDIERNRKKKRVLRQRIKSAIGIAVALVATVVLILMTPLFNIKEIRLDGNDTVSKEIINTKIGEYIGVNIFGPGEREIRQRMLEIPQVRDVEVKKAIFPTRLELYITESRPAGYVLCGETTLVIDSDLRIVDDASVFDYDKLPSISGVSVSDYELNKKLEIKSEEKEKILTELLKSFEVTGIIGEVKYISIDDLASITFNYDNRIDVLCGSQLQLERKIRMFAESIQTSVFDENSIGTIDLSVPGTASYTS